MCLDVESLWLTDNDNDVFCDCFVPASGEKHKQKWTPRYVRKTRKEIFNDINTITGQLYSIIIEQVPVVIVPPTFAAQTPKPKVITPHKTLQQGFKTLADGTVVPDTEKQNSIE